MFVDLQQVAHILLSDLTRVFSKIVITLAEGIFNWTELITCHAVCSSAAADGDSAPTCICMWSWNLVSNYTFFFFFVQHERKKCFEGINYGCRGNSVWFLAWRAQTWVAQTCESAKQTTHNASAVTIWEIVNSMYFFIPRWEPIWSGLAFGRSSLQTQSPALGFSRFISKTNKHPVEWVIKNSICTYSTHQALGDNRSEMQLHKPATVFPLWSVLEPQ